MGGVREMREGPRAGTMLCTFFALEQGWNPAMSDGFDMASALSLSAAEPSIGFDGNLFKR